MTCNKKTIVSVKLLHPDAIMPQKATEGSSGFDLFSAEEDLWIPDGDKSLIGTGISIKMQPGYEAQIRSRSGLAWKNFVTVLNSPGTIDNDYTGEIKVILVNNGSTGDGFLVRKGDRIAQMVIQPVPNAELWLTVDALPTTDRGAGGFGSTGQ